MKAIRVHEIGAPQVMRLEEVPDLRPGRGEVLVRIEAAGVNPVDTYIRAGAYPVKKSFPYTPGLDAAGVIEAVGDDVGHRHGGERVYVAGSLSGTYAELALCREEQVHPLPDKISFAQGAALGVPYGTAWYGLFVRGGAQPGEFVLIHGASGGVGTAALQLARAIGMQVIGTAGSDRGRQLALAQGAHQVLDHHAPDYLARIPELTCGHGVDVVLEMLANVNLGQDLRILATGGRVVVVGSRGTAEIDPREAMGRNGSILGLTLFNATPEQLRAVHAALGAGMENGIVRPVIGRDFPLAKAAAAHEAIMTPGAYGKIVLLP